MTNLCPDLSRKKEKNQINKIRNEKGEVTTDNAEIQRIIRDYLQATMRLPRWLSVKNLPANAGDAGSIPALGISPGEGNGNSLQYSCPMNSVDRGAWWATVHGVAKSGT